MTYAMKKLAFCDKSSLRLAEKESITMSKIRHRNICGYRDTLVEDTNLYIVMEFCDRGDLSGFI